MNKKIILLILYFTSPAILTTAIYSTNTTRYGQLNIFIPMMLGAAAYTWLCIEFVLIARVKMMEKSIGQDRFYKFHGIMALVSVVLAFIHKILQGNMMGESLKTTLGDISIYIFIAITVLSFVFMAEMLVLKVNPLMKMRRFAQKLKVFSYKYQRLLHNLTTIAITLLLAHVLLTTTSRVSLLVRVIYIVYFIVAISAYIYFKFLKPLMRSDMKFIVKAVKQESDNMWTIEMVPQSKTIFKYEAGQFGFIKIYGEDISKEEHPFSISSQPENKEFISITVKELGDYTSTINNVKPGYRAIVDAPYGNFTLREIRHDEELVLLAGGVGITPVMSLLRYMSQMDKDRKVLLLWGIKNPNEMIWHKEFDQILETMKNLSIVPVMSMDNTWEGEKGFLTQDKIMKHMKEKGISADKAHFYICGPAIMVDMVLKGLKSIKVNKSNIHFERFSL